jgi:RNA polymerase sigma-70 factor (ECF subfamily)
MGIPLEVSILYDIPVVNNTPSAKRPAFGAAEDPEVVSCARTGDFAAFEELVRRYRNDVFRLSYHFLQDREEAWDISQEVFLKVYRALGQFRGEANFKTWLLRITANQCKDYLKKRRLQTVAFDERIRTEPASGAADPGNALEAEELGRAIQAALDRLSHKHRTAFLLREFEGLSYEEMAQVMNCNVGTVMSRLHHARQKLQRILIRMGAVEDRTNG